MRKFILILLFVLLCGTAFGAADFFPATGLTGGTTGKLDAIDVTLDGIDNADIAIIETNGVAYHYYFNASSGAAESSPDTIKPDLDNGVAYSGNGRWILQGIYAETIQLESGTSVNEVSTDGAMAGNSDDAVPTEQAVVEYIPQIIPTLIPGGVITRTKATYSDTDTITLTPAVYHHSGTAEQIVYWDATLTFDFGSGGSNAASDDLTASAWHYLYIDDSALSGTVITAARLLNDTTAPTWDDTDHAWMNGHDRCIGAFLTDGSSQILEFFHEGDLVVFADYISSHALADLDTSWTDVTLSMPGFSTIGYVTFYSDWVNGDSALYWRTNGQSATVGHAVVAIETNAAAGRTTATVITDSSQKIEIKHSESNGNQAAVYTEGFYLPIGI